MVSEGGGGGRIAPHPPSGLLRLNESVCVSGNAGAAFVEVLVGKSTSRPVDYQVSTWWEGVDSCGADKLTCLTWILFLVVQQGTPTH